MTNRKRFWNLLSFTLFIVGFLVRLFFLPVRTMDMGYYLTWYNHIVSNGVLHSLSDHFIEYNPPFIYLLSLATLTKSFLPRIWAIKFIPITFDIINTGLVFQITKTYFDDVSKSIRAALIFWAAPTIMINSSVWGQTDSLYACFLLLAFLFLLKDRPAVAMIAFALSISIKAQGIFMAPFLAILFLKKQIKWYTFLLIPPVYALPFLPAILAGRPINILFSTYMAQGETFLLPSMNAATLYFFLPQSAYPASLQIGIPLASLILFVWVLVYGLKHYELTKTILATTALVATAFTPFLLPKMHDRYFYAADIFSIVLAVTTPKMWFLAAAYQVISLLSYTPYLFGINPESTLPTAVIVNTITLGFLLWKQWNMIANPKTSLMRPDNTSLQS